MGAESVNPIFHGGGGGETTPPIFFIAGPSINKTRQKYPRQNFKETLHFRNNLSSKDSLGPSE